MIEFYEYPKCSTCRKAKAELQGLDLDFSAIDLTVDTPSEATILTWMEQSDLSIKSYFNTSGIKYRELGLKDKVDSLNQAQAAALLATDGMLIKRPVLVEDGRVRQIGYRTAYAELGL